MSQIDLFLLAGEPSGDLQGAALLAELLSLDPTLRIAAVAGPRMRQFPIQCIEPMENLCAMGFTDVLLALPKIARLFFSLRRKILELSPKAFIAIDYPGFNLRLHRSLNRKRFPGKHIHYICPTVWAWGKKRIPLIARNLDLLLTILPFEPPLFAKTPLRAEYVGHPLVHAISTFRPDPTFRARHNFAPTDKILALFPGSRPQEIERNLPLMLQAAKALQAQDPDLRIAFNSETYNLMHNAHLALAKSGTVALELALHKIPTVVQYAIKPIDVFLATKVFKIHLPHYSLPNILSQTEIFPELFGPNLTPEALLSQAQTLWFDESKRAACIAGCARLDSILGTQNASRVAAKLVLEQIHYNL